MIDVDSLNGFLDKSSRLIKGSGCSTVVNGIPKCEPLCSFKLSLDGGSILFSVEARGFIKDEVAFFLVARQGEDGDKFISRGYFTAAGGHRSTFAITHDEPRGMSIQQGILIEMRNLVERMGREQPSAFLEDALKQLSGVEVKIQVVKSDGDVLSRVDDAGLGEFKADDGIPDETVGKLERNPGKTLVEQQTEACCGSFDRQEQIEDTCGESFAKAVGENEEKPDMDNPLDEALAGTQVYQIKKETAWERLVKFFRRLFRLDREREQLDCVCSEMFGDREVK